MTLTIKDWFDVYVEMRKSGRNELAEKVENIIAKYWEKRPDTLRRCVLLYREGRKIDAIKEWKAFTGQTLIAAKKELHTYELAAELHDKLKYVHTQNETNETVSSLS